MANVKIWGPNASFIQLTRVGVCFGGKANSRFGIWVKANFSVFNAKR